MRLLVIREPGAQLTVRRIGLGLLLLRFALAEESGLDEARGAAIRAQGAA